MVRISQKAQLMPASAIRKLVPLSDSAKKQGVKVYHLNMGQPDAKINSPECALDAVRNFKGTNVSYSNSAGLMELREGLVEKYYRPTIVLTKSNGYITGSARSIPEFDLYEAIESCSDLLENFGGHTYAAGLTMKEENLREFTKRFETYVREKVTKEILTPIVHIDSFLEFRQITPKFFRVLKQFQPFGPGNLSPVFLTENVYDNGNGRKVGTDNGHLKLELIQEDEPYRSISAIAFNQSEHFEHLQAGNPVDICYSISENYYRGIANIQLRIKDIRNREDFI